MVKKKIRKSMTRNWHDLIFSNQIRPRRTRHLLFWLIWLFYFTGSFFYEQQGLRDAGSLKWIFIIFFKSSFLLLCHAFLVYTVIYFLLPGYAFKGRYIIFSIGLLIAISITVAWAYFCYAVLFPAFDAWILLYSGITRNTMLWNSAVAGLISALKVVSAAIVIKLLKRWYLQQQMNEQIEREKFMVELQLLKAQIHPDFLFNSLDSLYFLAVSDPPKASELLLRLSDLLSYMLYECDLPKVELEKELKMIRDYIYLEKTRIGCRLETDINIKGNTNGAMIAPLLLLPLIENSFSYCSNKSLERTWINLDLRIEEDVFFMKLINGKPIDGVIPDLLMENGLINVQKRLKICYPEKSEIRILAEPEMMMTSLKINLGIS
jgi:sensor histidine kinase YesM